MGKSIAVLTINQFKATAVPDFYANTLSDHLLSSHLHIDKPHRHDFFVTMLFTKGEGVHHIDFETYEVKPGAVFMMAPGQMHHWALSPDADGWIFFHSRTFYETHYADEKLDGYPFFSPLQLLDALYFAQDITLATLMRQLYEMDIEPALQKRYVLSLIAQVYLQLEQQFMVEKPETQSLHSGYYAKFRTFGVLLERHFKEEKSVGFYAAKCHMTPKHLNRICQAIAGKPSSQIIIERVMLEAKRLLVHGTQSMAQVGQALGYEDYAYFSKLFRKKTGTNPSAFLQKSSGRL